MEPSLGRSASTDRIAQSLATLTAKNTASREDMDDPALAELSGITSQTSQGLAADVYAEAAALDAAAAGAGGAAGAEAAAAGAGAGDEAGAAPPAAAEALPGSPMGRSPPAAGAPDAYAAVTPAPEPAAADAGAGVGAGASSGGSVRSSSSAGLLESPDKEIVRLELAQDRFPSDPRDPDVPRTPVPPSGQFGGPMQMVSGSSGNFVDPREPPVGIPPRTPVPTESDRLAKFDPRSPAPNQQAANQHAGGQQLGAGGGDESVRRTPVPMAMSAAMARDFDCRSPSMLTELMRTPVPAPKPGRDADKLPGGGGILSKCLRKSQTDSPRNKEGEKENEQAHP